MRTFALQVSGTVIALMAFASSLNGQKGKPFESGCATLPFESIKSAGLTIDKICGVVGSATKNSPSAKQNEAKNNFCAQGTPVALTFADFDRLQELFGEAGLPADRKVLKGILPIEGGGKIGEGNIVTLEGFVYGAQHSNTKYFKFRGKPGHGETVNCESGALTRNDIHIQLAESKEVIKKGSAGACETLTAEISPHFRPAAWDRFDINPKTKDKGPKRSLKLSGARVRLTGQLFFDGSHSPCKNGTGSPARRSTWEIHPVYAIDVFDTDTSEFVPLDQWAESH